MEVHVDIVTRKYDSNGCRVWAMKVGTFTNFADLEFEIIWFKCMCRQYLDALSRSEADNTEDEDENTEDENENTEDENDRWEIVTGKPDTDEEMDEQIRTAPSRREQVGAELEDEKPELEDEKPEPEDEKTELEDEKKRTKGAGAW